MAVGGRKVANMVAGRPLPKRLVGKPGLHESELYKWIEKKDLLNYLQVQGWVDVHRVACLRLALARLEQLLADPKMTRKVLLAMMRREIEEIGEFGPCTRTTR